MESKHVSILDDNANLLVSNIIMTDGFIKALKERGVLPEIMIQETLEGTNQQDQNRRLLQNVKALGARAFQRLCDVLDLTGHKFLCEHLRSTIRAESTALILYQHIVKQVPLVEQAMNEQEQAALIKSIQDKFTQCLIAAAWKGGNSLVKRKEIELRNQLIKDDINKDLEIAEKDKEIYYLKSELEDERHTLGKYQALIAQLEAQIQTMMAEQEVPQAMEKMPSCPKERSNPAMVTRLPDYTKEESNPAQMYPKEKSKPKESSTLARKRPKEHSTLIQNSTLVKAYPREDSTLAKAYPKEDPRLATECTESDSNLAEKCTVEDSKPAKCTEADSNPAKCTEADSNLAKMSTEEDSNLAKTSTEEDSNQEKRYPEKDSDLLKMAKKEGERADVNNSNGEEKIPSDTNIDEILSKMVKERKEVFEELKLTDDGQSLREVLKWSNGRMEKAVKNLSREIQKLQECLKLVYCQSPDEDDEEAMIMKMWESELDLKDDGKDIVKVIQDAMYVINKANDCIQHQMLKITDLKGRLKSKVEGEFGKGVGVGKNPLGSSTPDWLAQGSSTGHGTAAPPPRVKQLPPVKEHRSSPRDNLVLRR